MFDTAATNLLPNLTARKRIHENLVAIGPVPFDEADIDFARKIQATFTQEAIRSSIKLYQITGCLLQRKDRWIYTAAHGLRAFEGPISLPAGSTDVGDVSPRYHPSAQVLGSAWAIGTNLIHGRWSHREEALPLIKRWFTPRSLASTGLDLAPHQPFSESKGRVAKRHTK